MSQNKPSAEDRLDRVYRLLAFVFLTIGALKSLGAIQLIVPRDSLLGGIAPLVRQALLIVAPLLCALTLWKGVSFKRSCRGCSLIARDGFVFHAIQNSVIRAGLLTFLSLVLMQELADYTTLPSWFYLNLALAIMMLTFSISFLASSYVGAERD